MQIPGTLLHPCQFQAGCVPTQTSPFHCFLVSLIKISCHVNGLQQSYAEWGHPLPNWGCHWAVPGEKVASGGQLPSQPPSQHQGGHSVSCATPGDTLHSSEQRGEGMEHTQSCEFCLGGAFGSSSPPSPLSERPPRMGTHLKAQVAPSQAVPSGEMAKLIQST